MKKNAPKSPPPPPSDLEVKLIEEANKRYSKRTLIFQDYGILSPNIENLESKSLQDLRDEGLLECMACGS